MLSHPKSATLSKELMTALYPGFFLIFFCHPTSLHSHQKMTRKLKNPQNKKAKFHTSRDEKFPQELIDKTRVYWKRKPDVRREFKETAVLAAAFGQRPASVYLTRIPASNTLSLTSLQELLFSFTTPTSKSYQICTR